MEEQDLFSNIMLMILIAVCIVAVFKKLKLSTVLGYFVAGSLIGDHGIKLVTYEQTYALAEAGVIFLLFAIGLELTFERLRAMRGSIFALGGLQVFITGCIFAFFAYYYFGENSHAAIIIGGGLALSSTAVVLQVLSEQRQQSTQIGRLSLATLITQDLAVVPLLVLVPLLANPSNTSNITAALGIAILKAAIVLVLILVIGRLLLRPIFNALSGSNPTAHNELFIATVLLIALGSAWITYKMGLSMALGAFVAGLLVAETEFQVQAEESIAPFKALLLGLFFMNVGMSLDVSIVLHKAKYIIFFSLALLLIKGSIIALLSYLFRFGAVTSIYAGLLLSQGGEFAFVLFGLAAENNLLSVETKQILLIVVTITMAVTPLFGTIGNFINQRFDQNTKFAMQKITNEIADLSNHVIIIGFGRVGKMVSMLLQAENINYVAIDLDAEHVTEARKEGFPVYLGDANNIETLKAVGIERSSSIIISIHNMVTAKKSCKLIHMHFPQLPIIIRAEDLKYEDNLYAAGATTIVPETYETGLQLGGAVLKSVGVSEFEVSRIKNLFRMGDYVKLPKNHEPEDLV